MQQALLCVCVAWMMATDVCAHSIALQGDWQQGWRAVMHVPGRETITFLMDTGASWALVSGAKCFPCSANETQLPFGGNDDSGLQLVELSDQAVLAGTVQANVSLLWQLDEPPWETSIFWTLYLAEAGNENASAAASFRIESNTDATGILGLRRPLSDPLSPMANAARLALHLCPQGGRATWSEQGDTAKFQSTILAPIDANGHLHVTRLRLANQSISGAATLSLDTGTTLTWLPSSVIAALETTLDADFAKPCHLWLTRQLPLGSWRGFFARGACADVSKVAVPRGCFDQDDDGLVPLEVAFSSGATWTRPASASYLSLFLSQDDGGLQVCPAARALSEGGATLVFGASFLRSTRLFFDWTRRTVAEEAFVALDPLLSVNCTLTALSEHAWHLSSWSDCICALDTSLPRQTRDWICVGLDGTTDAAQAGPCDGLVRATTPALERSCALSQLANTDSDCALRAQGWITQNAQWSPCAFNATTLLTQRERMLTRSANPPEFLNQVANCSAAWVASPNNTCLVACTAQLDGAALSAGACGETPMTESDACAPGFVPVTRAWLLDVTADWTPEGLVSLAGVVGSMTLYAFVILAFFQARVPSRAV